MKMCDAETFTDPDHVARAFASSVKAPSVGSTGTKVCTSSRSVRAVC
jgi:hypothetical protein